MNKKRVIWIELLRIMACIGVIGIHAASQHFRDIPVESSVWAVSNFYHGINRFAVGCFVMISGCLYLDKKRTWDLKRLWKRNILPIAVAYIFWQMVYSVYRIGTSDIVTKGTRTIVCRFLINVSKSYFHLWYLPMLIGLLIITPLLWEIVNSSRGSQWEVYMILLCLGFQILPYTVECFSFPQKEYVMNVLQTVQPQILTGYVGYFILGHYLSHYEISKKLEYFIYIAGIVLIGTAILLCQEASLKSGKEVQTFYENYTLATGFWATSVFLFFKNHISKIRWGEKQEKIICYLGNCTFGVYLIHALIRNILHRAGIDSMMIGNTVLAIPVVIALIFVISLAAVMLIKKIPLVGKWIV
ncbi:acyltransferase [Blautia sp. MSJ-19]|uniref:acyltransferase n=1 Tax=Blautia sp. MSJ-19 TaxID=2841517 RepID=UPI001C0F29AB|nr:acyltransferase family protein [Blautia sp. MSJ-19]MBU5480182.1 acyltransferase family protein [Blautia sp. MSJ-19]